MWWSPRKQPNERIPERDIDALFAVLFDIRRELTSIRLLEDEDDRPEAEETPDDS